MAHLRCLDPHDEPRARRAVGRDPRRRAIQLRHPDFQEQPRVPRLVSNPRRRIQRVVFVEAKAGLAAASAAHGKRAGRAVSRVPAPVARSAGRAGGLPVHGTRLLVRRRRRAAALRLHRRDAAIRIAQALCVGACAFRVGRAARPAEPVSAAGAACTGKAGRRVERGLPAFNVDRSGVSPPPTALPADGLGAATGARAGLCLGRGAISAQRLW
jgi:hypothetical protein